jgi:hypothetical protein
MTKITTIIVQSMSVVLTRRSASPWRHLEHISGHELVDNENGNLHRKRFLVLAGSFKMKYFNHQFEGLAGRQAMIPPWPPAGIE